MAYSINISNGSGNENVLNGNYSASVTSTGYDGSTLNPSTVNVTDGVNSYTFTVGATGTLTLHVTETGTVDGTPIVGAKFKRCDSLGNEYGDEITTNDSGNAVFNNVPFADTNAPKIYYKQTSSDGSHEYSSTLADTTMTSSTSTIEITNALPVTRTFTLNDANYTGLPIETATLSLQ